MVGRVKRFDDDKYEFKFKKKVKDEDEKKDLASIVREA